MIQDWRSLSSEVLSCHATYCMCRYHPALFTSPYGHWGPGNQCKNANTLAAGIVVSHKLPSISAPRVSCLPDLWNSHKLTYQLAGRVSSETFHSSWHLTLSRILQKPERLTWCPESRDRLPVFHPSDDSWFFTVQAHFVYKGTLTPVVLCQNRQWNLCLDWQTLCLGSSFPYFLSPLRPCHLLPLYGNRAQVPTTPRSGQSWRIPSLSCYSFFHLSS